MNTRLMGAALVLACAACGGDDETGPAQGDGAVALEVWGEEYIEEQIPTAEFADGWSVTYDQFLVVLDGVSVGGATLEGPSMVMDLTAPGPHSIGTLTGVADGTQSVGYSLVIASAETVAHASADQAALDRMVADGLSVYAAGTATDGTTTKTFAWGFARTTRYFDCVDVSGGQELVSVVVPDGGEAQAQLTIHGDHLFYDDLQSGDASLRFANYADADADGDGDVTMAELDAVPLATIPSERGPYGVAASDVNDLGAYVRASTRTLGHFQGEGHCSISQE